VRPLARDLLSRLVRELEHELEGGPRAELSQEVQHLAQLLRVRELRAGGVTSEGELLAVLPDAAAIVAQDGRVREANGAFHALSPRGNAIGLGPLEVIRSAELAEAVKKALQGVAHKLELSVPAARQVYVAHLAPLSDGEALWLLRDVTEAKRAEAARRDLVANASHELRTPVAAIAGAAETLLSGALADPEQARTFVDMIARHAQRLSRLTQELLDLSRIESRQWRMTIEPVDVAHLAQSVLDLYEAQSAQKPIALERHTAEGLSVMADARALEQVVVNLVDNAVKYTPAGGTVAVRASREGRHGVIAVTDTGPGIERHHLARIFERFYRADAGRSRDVGGTGLGLAIVKHLVQAQGGEVGVESDRGGSRFWVRLPVAS
jgi:two-component system phosphate regulon sensor histidine kinase PhoR